MHQQCEALGIDSGIVSAVVARSAESLRNPLYGIRDGAPYGGACLPKDTTAFRAFCTEHELPHRMLAATIAVNEQLQLSIPAVASPDEIDGVCRHPLFSAGNSLLAPEA